MVTQVLHDVCERAAGCPEFVWVLVGSGGVNQVDEGLGQPRQVMTAGTYGPSGQLIFVIVTPHSIVCEAALLRSSSEPAPWLHVAAWVR